MQRTLKKQLQIKSLEDKWYSLASFAFKAAVKFGVWKPKHSDKSVQQAVSVTILGPILSHAGCCFARRLSARSTAVVFISWHHYGEEQCLALCLWVIAISKGPKQFLWRITTSSSGQGDATLLRAWLKGAKQEATRWWTLIIWAGILRTTEWITQQMDVKVSMLPLKTETEIFWHADGETKRREPRMQGDSPTLVLKNWGGQPGVCVPCFGRNSLHSSYSPEVKVIGLENLPK